MIEANVDGRPLAYAAQGTEVVLICIARVAAGAVSTTSKCNVSPRLSSVEFTLVIAAFQAESIGALKDFW